MSRFLDQIRKAKEARQRAERERQAGAGQDSAPDKDAVGEDTLVPEPAPRPPAAPADKAPAPPPLDDDTDKELFPPELEDKPGESPAEPEPEAIATDGEPLFPPGIENPERHQPAEPVEEEPEAEAPPEPVEYPAELESPQPAGTEPAEPGNDEEERDTLPSYESIESAAEQAREERERLARERRESEEAQAAVVPEVSVEEPAPAEPEVTIEEPTPAVPETQKKPAGEAAHAEKPEPDPLDNIVEKLEKRLASRQPAAPKAPPPPPPPAPPPGALREGPDDSEEDLFPTELNDESGIDEAKAASAVGFFAEGGKDHTRERYERKRRRRLRQEVTLDGPPVNEAFIKRIAKVAPDPDPRALCFWDPKNHICEEYRLLGKNIIHAFADDVNYGRRGRVVSLSSSVRGEGKTLTIVNLVLALAQDLRDRIVVVDGDLRNPKVHKYLGTTNRAGLNDMLEASDPEAILEDSLVRTDLGLHMLLSKSSGDKSPAPILDTERMTAVLDLLRERYSLVILDTPPVLLATDALSLGVRSDGMLFLLRARKTQREMIQEARQRIARLDINLLGYVINNVKSFLPRIWKYGRYYYGRYGNY